MIHDILPINNYTGNNSSTTFDFDFYIENASQLKVYHFDSSKIKRTLIQDIDYSINELRNINGSYITFPLEGSAYSILGENENLSLELSLPISQETQYNNSSLLNLQALEYSFDYLTRLIQILSRKVSLCVSVEECSDTSPQELLENINSKAIQVSDLASSVSNYYDLISDYNSNISAIDEKFDTYNSKFDSIDSKADTELSNLSSEGQKVIDGQWVESSSILASNISAPTSTDLEYSLASYLPNDGYNYEVLFTGQATSGASSGNVCNIHLKTDIIADYVLFARAITKTTSNNSTYGTCILPVGTNRKATVVAYSANTGAFYLYARGYRRIGTNV